MAWPNKKKAPDSYLIPLTHPITKEACPIPDKGWRNPPKGMKELLDKDMILFGKDESVQPRRKYILEDNLYENIPSILFFGGSDDRFFKNIGLSFDNPKPHNFSKELISYFLKKDEIILDFFAGSATVSHATMTLNADDGANRKCISVQLPEPTKKKDKAYKDGFKRISDISKERIRMAGEEIKKNSLNKRED